MINPETIKREKILFAYTSALEQGDFARLEAILEMARSDAVLERQIMEVNAALSQPQEAAAPLSAPASLGLKLWQQIKSAAAGLFSLRTRFRPSLRSMAVVLSAMLVMVVGVMALLGPAIGRVFSNVVQYAPPGAFQQTFRQATSYPAVAKTPMVAATTQASSYAPYPAPISLPSTNPSNDRLIVRNGSLTVVATDTRLARQTVMALVAEFSAEGAFVVAANETYPFNDQMPAITMVLRVPVSRYEESMTRLAGLGVQVLSRVENAQDVTQDYVDVTGRIEALETSRARLLEIIKDAKSTDDLLRAEQELAQRESELEAAKARQQNLAKTAALSSISLDLRPAITSQPVTDSEWNPAATIHNALGSLLTTLRNLADSAIIFAITTLPWLVVIGLLVYGGVRIFRSRQKK
jgi:hypothetical protein